MTVYSGISFSCARHTKFTEGAITSLLAELYDYFSEKHGSRSRVWRNTINVRPASSYCEGCLVFSPTRTEAWILARSRESSKSDVYHLLRLLRSRFLEAVGRFSPGTQPHVTETVTSSSSIRKQVATQGQLPVLESYPQEVVVSTMAGNVRKPLCIGADRDPDQASDLLHYPDKHVSVMTLEGRDELLRTFNAVQDVQQLAVLLKVSAVAASQLSACGILEEWESSGFHQTTEELMRLLEPAKDQIPGVQAICIALLRENVRVSVHPPHPTHTGDYHCRVSRCTLMSFASMCF